MAYTNVWSSAAPLGSIPANTLDEELRKARLDLEERLLDKVFNSPFTADPLVVRPEILGNVTAKKIYLPAWSFFSHGDFADTRAASNMYVWDAVGGQVYRANVILPQGVTITRAKLLIRNGSTNTIKWNIKKINFGTSPSVTDVFAETTIHTSSGTPVVEDSGALTEVVGASMYFIWVDLKTNGFIYGAEITYDTPDCRNTL